MATEPPLKIDIIKLYPTVLNIEYKSYSILDTYYDWDMESKASVNKKHTPVLVGQEKVILELDIFIRNKNVGDGIPGIHRWHDSVSKKSMETYRF